jgi:hypothetical protein
MLANYCNKNAKDENLLFANYLHGHPRPSLSLGKRQGLYFNFLEFSANRDGKCANL